MRRRSDIASVPEDINSCMPPSRLQLRTIQEDLNGEGSEDPHTHQQIIQKLRRKFFPLKEPPPFFQDIFDLVANTRSVSTCKIDLAINSLERASDVARHDPQMQTDAHEQGNNTSRRSSESAIQEKSKDCGIL